MPEGIRRDHFLHWVNQLPERQTPSWLGLTSEAEKVLLKNQGSVMVSKLLKLQLLEDDDEIAYVSAESKETASQSLTDGRPSWIRNLSSSAQSWISLLPDNLPLLKRTVENIKDPLFRCFEREITRTSKLLNIVLLDLKDVILICKGEKRQTNHHRMMISDLAKGVIPKTWKFYVVPQATTVIQWITDFADRVRQLNEISSLYSSTKETAALQRINVWLGGFLNPEAYITATRQYVAQMNGWSLEELILEIDIKDTADNSDHL
jgi:dynein heavy chain 1